MDIPDDEQIFIRAARRLFALTQQQEDDGRALQDKMRDLGLVPKPIGDILLERGVLTAEQKDQITEQVEKVREAFRIPGYRLLKRLGRGSIGTVYKARQLDMEREVAIKILARFLSENPAFVRRFKKEAKVIGKLNHPNIVQGYDAGDVNGTHYFVMEYCPGPTLLSILDRGGALDQDRGITLVTQIARALDHAHDQGLVHRDIKPDNIMIAPGSIAKLCDLGLAKDVSLASGSTEKGATMGTPNYISPEQARGDAEIDIRSDIYSLGATFYHILTGTPPFDGPNPTVIMVKHVNEKPVPPRERNPDIDPEVEQIIERMMAKNPTDRYQSPADLLVDLENAEARRAGQPLPHAVPFAPSPPQKRHRRALRRG